MESGLLFAPENRAACVKPLQCPNRAGPTARWTCPALHMTNPELRIEGDGPATRAQEPRRDRGPETPLAMTSRASLNRRGRARARGTSAGAPPRAGQPARGCVRASSGPAPRLGFRAMARPSAASAAGQSQSNKTSAPCPARARLRRGQDLPRAARSAASRACAQTSRGGSIAIDRAGCVDLCESPPTRAEFGSNCGRALVVVDRSSRRWLASADSQNCGPAHVEVVGFDVLPVTPAAGFHARRREPESNRPGNRRAQLLLQIEQAGRLAVVRVRPHLHLVAHANQLGT